MEVEKSMARARLAQELCHDRTPRVDDRYATSQRLCHRTSGWRVSAHFSVEPFEPLLERAFKETWMGLQ